MAITTQQLQKLYIAYYGRAAEPGGFSWWQTSGYTYEQVADRFAYESESTNRYDYLKKIKNGEAVTAEDKEQFVSQVYANLFNREPDQGGKDFWVAKLDELPDPGALVRMMADGAQNEDAVMIANKIEVAQYYTDYVIENGGLSPSSSIIDGVDASAESVASAKVAVDNLGREVFTLKEIREVEELPDTYPTKSVVFWGDPETGEGIPAGLLWGTLKDYLSTAADMTDNLFDINDSLEEIKNITIEGVDDETQGGGVDVDIDGDDNSVDVEVGAGGDYTGDYQIIVELSDGTINSAVVTLTQAQFEYLNGLIFDENGDPRLFVKQVAYKVDSGLTDADDNPILVPAVIEGDVIVTDYPIILTPDANNGGTEEQGYASVADNLIVAGRLELLHQAYIDAGAGVNTLEIDAKGHFAQPKELLNIQHIKVENLPNVYTTTDDGDPIYYSDSPDPDGDNVGDVYNDYPDVQEDGAANPNSVIDISRAVDIETLTVTEANFEGLEGQDMSGSLTIAGIRNGAVTTLDGGFTQDVALHYGELQGEGVQLVFNNLSMGDSTTVSGSSDGPQLIVAHNAEELTIETTGGDSYLYNGDLGGNLRKLTITGTEHLYIEGDLDDSFHDETPITIDASQNSGGVNLYLEGTEQVTFLGSTADDRFYVYTDEISSYEGWFDNDELVVIQGGVGDNYYEVETFAAEITNADGDNNYEIDVWQATITAGDGDNFLEGYAVNLTAQFGDGDNYIVLDGEWDAENSSALDFDDFTNDINLTLGNGANEVHIDSGLDEGSSITVTGGDGGNQVTVIAQTVTVTTGDGDDVIDASGDSITISTAGGNDTITIDGQDDDYVTEPGQDDDGHTSNGVPSLTPASDGVLLAIDTGSGSATINLGRDTDNNDDGDITEDGATLTAMEGSVITGENITLVVKTDADLRAASLSGISSVVLDDDNQTVEGQGYEDDAATLTLTDTQFTALGAAAFSVEGAFFGAHAVVEIVVTQDTSLTDLGVDALADGVKLRLYVEDGVTLTMTAEQLHTYVTQDGVIQAEPQINYEAPGKVIVTDAGFTFEAFVNDDGSGYSGDLGGVAQGFGSNNVQIQRTADGFERPAPEPTTDDFHVQDGDTINNFERVYDSAFDPATDGAQWMNVIAPGGSDARVNINVTNGATVGNPAGGILHGGIHSQNVSTFVVTGINTTLTTDGDALQSQNSAASATIFVCDNTEGLDVLGLQNNRKATITFNQVNWGTEILLEGDGYANSSDQEKNLGNPDLSEVGAVVVNFFESGANAVVNINNQGVALGMNEDAEDGYDAAGERVLDVAGVTVNNADRLTINVEDGDAVVHNLMGSAVERLIVNGVEDVTVEISSVSSLKTIDAQGVADIFTLSLTASGSYDFSEVDLLDIDRIILGDNVELILSADDLVTLADKIVDGGANTELDVTGFSTQVLDLSVIDVDNIGTVTTADVDGVIVVDPGVDFGFADEVIINAQSSDTTLQMTVDQYNTYCHTDAIEGGFITCVSGDDYSAILRLTEVAADEQIELSRVDQETVDDPEVVDVVIEVSDITATTDFAITSGTYTLEVSGAVDLTKGNIEGTVDVNFTGDATLTLTADQIVAIELAYGGADESAFSMLAGLNVTLNVVDLSDQELDLDAIAEAGINIGTVSIENTDGAITIAARTTFGNADEIVTPTAEAGDPDYGTEQTAVTMTVKQFLSSAGVISGDSRIDLTELFNNIDTDSDYVPDTADFDFSAIANAGVISFAPDTDGPAGSDDHVITMSSTADLGGFTVILGNGDLIRFANETQASREIVLGDVGDGATGVQWMWTTFGTAVDTSEYDAGITTLFIDEALLVSQPREEDLWTSLDGSIVVEKFNGETIPELVKYDRVNTFEAFTNIGGGINYDDDDAFGTVAQLTMNLEGEVNLGDILLGDTNNGDGSTPNIDGKGFFRELIINSYKDLSNVEGYDPESDNVPGRIIEANYLGNISLNAGSVDELVDVTINTYADADNVLQPGDPVFGSVTSDGGFYDEINVNSAAAERDGMAIEVGTITFAANEAKPAELVLNGDNDITLGGVDISDPEISLLTVDANNFTGELEIGGIAPVTALNAYGFIYVVDGHVAEAGELLGDAEVGPVTNPDLLVVVGGDNDLTEATLDIEQVHITADSTLTLTEAQVQAIGEGNFSVDAGVSVTLNVTEVSNGSTIDLNTIQDAGFNIGVVSTADENVTLNDAATLGGADELRVVLDDADNTLTLTATQYLQLNGGNITELDTDLVTSATPNRAHVVITDLSTASNAVDIVNPNGDDRVSVNIDLSTVATTGDHTLQIADAGTAADVTIDNTSDLGDFTVVLDDIDDAVPLTPTPNELAGQTVRFTTEAQAARAVDVVGYDSNGTPDDGTEADTNVVWDFDSASGPIDTSRYDGELGRLWVSDELVKSDNDLEDLFAASDLNGNSLQDDINLNGSIIVRIVNTQELELIDYASQGVSRTVEIEAYTDLSSTGLVFDEQDQLVHVDNLTIDLGGEVKLGNLQIDNIIRTTDTDPDSDQFNTLTINSYLADTAGHYLLPEDFVPGLNVYPTGGNEVGDISAGTTRNELAHVVVNAHDVEITIREILFAEDTAGSTAIFTVNGDNDVTVKSLDTTDPEITGLMVTNNLTGGAVLAVTGGSPGLDGGTAVGNTETLTIDSDGGTTTFGSAKTAPATGEWAGVYGETLSLIDLKGADGTVNLGVIAGVDSEDFTIDGLGGGTTTVSFTLGEADANGLKAPELSATGEWVFRFDTADTVNMTITSDAVLNAGGTLTLTNVDALSIDGAVDLSDLVLTLGVTTVDVPAGSSLTLTGEQADGLTITGGGDVVIVEAEDVADPDFSNIMANVGDTGTVTVQVDTSDDDDADTDPETITFNAANMGVANIVVSGDGTLQFTNDFVGHDRDNDPLTPDDFATITVGASATVDLTAAQADGLVVDGAGTVNVAITLPSAADLSGITATNVNAMVTGVGAFTGDFGGATVTLMTDTTSMTVEASVVDGVTVGYDQSNIDNPADGAEIIVINTAPSAVDVDLSNVTARNIHISTNINQNALWGTITFPVLTTDTITNSLSVDVDYPQGVTGWATNLDGQTITGEGTVRAFADWSTSAFDIDLSGITPTDPDDDGTPAFNPDNLVLRFYNDGDVNTLAPTANLGSFDVQVDGGETLVATGAQVSGLDVYGAGTLRVTNLTTGIDLSGVTTASVIGVVGSGTVDLSGVANLTAIDVETGANADLTIGAAQFSELNAGDNLFPADLAELNTLTVDVVYTISATDFDVDLVVQDTAANWTVVGPAAGILQAQVDDNPDGHWFTNTVLNSADSVTHTDLGSLVSASSGAVGVALVQDFFVFDGTIAAAPNLTAITFFSGFAGDGDKIDLSPFGDADSSAFDINTVLAGNPIPGIPIAIANPNDVFFLNGAPAGSADSELGAAATLTARNPYVETASTAYFVISDDDSTGIFEYNRVGVADAVISNGELQLIGTVSSTTVLQDIIA